MLKKILPWIGGIFACVGLILIFCDVISTIKRRDKTKTNVVGLVLLSIAVVGYCITDLVLPAVLENNNWPPLASLGWIALFWVYVILDAIVTMGDIKVARRKKRQRRIAEQAGRPDPNGDESVAEAQRVWEEQHAQQQVETEEISKGK